MSGRVALVAAAAAVAAFAVLCPALAVDDSPSYLGPGRSWATGNGLREDGRPLESRLPLYPLALGVVIRLFGDAPVTFSLLNATCHVAAVMLARAVLRRRLDPATADLASAAALLYPPLLTSTGLVLQESFLALLLSAFFYSLWRAVESGAAGWIAAAGAALGLSGLAKVTSLPLAVPAAVLVALGPPPAPRVPSGARPAARAGIFIVSVFLVLLPWAVRNHRVLGRLEVTNSNGGHTFLGGTVSNTITDWTALPEYVAARQEWIDGARSSHPVLEHYLYLVACRRIAAAPGRWLGLVLERTGRFMLPARHWLVAVGWARMGTFPTWYLGLTAINVALFAGTAWLVVLAVRQRDAPLLVGPLIVFGTQAVYAVTYASPRYGVTIGPVLMAAAVLAIVAPPAPGASER